MKWDSKGCMFFLRQVLANGSTQPTELKEHLMSAHSENVSKDFGFSHEKTQFDKEGKNK